MMQTEIAKVMSFGHYKQVLARFLGVSDVAICEWKRGRFVSRQGEGTACRCFGRRS